MQTYILGILIVVSGFSHSLISQNPDLQLQPILSGLSSPVSIAHTGDSLLYIVEQPGNIQIIDLEASPISIYPTPFLNITSRVNYGGERGLLGLAFHPQYATNGYFYVNYTRSGDGATVISRFQVTANPDSADPASELILYSFTQPFSNHNGGAIAFSPNDGYLYVATGDGGAGGDPGDRSQNPLLALGKILRFDVDAAAPYIPASNPFVGNAAVLDEIWATGLRNPWRMAFDQQNGDMWIGDVGQSAREEVDWQPGTSTGGENYGWRCREGNIPYNGTGCPPPATFVDPVFEYGRMDGCSITGGCIYRGTLYPNLVGHYIYGDYCNSNMWSLRSDGVGGWNHFTHNPTVWGGNISSFGEAANGEIYMTGLGGSLVHIIDISPLPVEILSFESEIIEESVLLSWTLEEAPDLDKFEIEMKPDKMDSVFEKIGETKSPEMGGSNGIDLYQFRTSNLPKGRYAFRLRQIDIDGDVALSNAIEVEISSEDEFYARIFPNPFTHSFILDINSSDNHPVTFQLFNVYGKSIYALKSFPNPQNQGVIQVEPGVLSPGIYSYIISMAGHSPINGKLVKY